jgi:hypothetical protein
VITLLVKGNCGRLKKENGAILITLRNFIIALEIR